MDVFLSPPRHRDMMKAMNVLTAIFAIAYLFAAGCTGIRYDHTPISYSPTAAARWDSPLHTTPAAGAPETSLRAKAVMFALQRLKSSGPIDDFGQHDVAALFKSLGARVDWSASRPLSDLVRAADRRHAYDAAALPRPGDVVLFHNQSDRNKNRTADDWLTGCGIVIARTGHSFTVLARTTRGPRRVEVSPRSPAVRSHNGKRLNSYLRVPRPEDPAGTEYLSGLLWAGRIDLADLLSR